MSACIAEGMLAPANGRNPGRQDRPVAPVCSFVVPKMGPKTGPKNGTAILLEEGKGFQNGGPVSGTRVLHTQSAPLCGQWVAETPEPFVCFPRIGLDKTSSKFHIEGPPSRMRFSYADAAPKAGPGGSAVWAQADWQPNAFSTSELWGNQLQQIMVGKACGSKTGKGRRTPCGQTPRRPRYPKLLLLKPRTSRLRPPNPHVNKGLRPSHLWLRPDYAPPTRMYIRDYVPPICWYTPLVRPDCAPQTRM